MQGLKNFLKHWFVPHMGNDHQPHILRTAAAATLIGIALFAEGALLLRQPGFTHSVFLGEILNSVLVDETNQNRAEASLGTLKTSPVLEAAAAAKAADMAAKSYFAHTSPEGLTPWHWFNLVGYHYEYAGENLAVDFTDSKSVDLAWMNSPTHRANILNGHYTEIGIATAQGTFEGHPTTFVVQLFGTPAPITVPLPVAVAAAAGPGQLAQAPKPVAKPTPKPTAVTTTPIPPPAQESQPPAETFVAIENPEFATSSPSSTAVAAVAPSDQAGTTQSSVTHASALQHAIANPARSVAVLAWFLALLVATAIAIKLFHVGFAYPRLVMNGLMVLIVLTAILALNQYHFVASVQVL